ncbi:hypothetical protein RD792_016682 [Penstemon davidsonii]|uniref:Uncharacterized protein n=1 Tax=Penstemon davidsonii TaxID=160366 RepID=A0ABR0CK79_9LAMI|nr:hypothetical protein RD792_016682 [Penstemon davidsonii]
MVFSSHSPKTQYSLNKILNLIQTHISLHPYFYLFVSFLSIQALVILFARNPLLCFSNHSTAGKHHPPSHHDVVSVVPTDDCPYGRVYSYDLPPMFNKDLLLSNCTDLNLWNWQCGIVTNHGYGGAATELRSILPENLYKSWYRTNQFTLEVIMI